MFKPFYIWGSISKVIWPKLNHILRSPPNGRQTFPFFQCNSQLLEVKLQLCVLYVYMYVLMCCVCIVCVCVVCVNVYVLPVYMLYACVLCMCICVCMCVSVYVVCVLYVCIVCTCVHVCVYVVCVLYVSAHNRRHWESRSAPSHLIHLKQSLS
jgi:hypothetical protein